MIRVLLFQDRPDCMAVFVHDHDGPQTLVIESPLTRERIREAAQAAGVEIRISEGAYVGRLRPVFDRLAKDARAERANQERERLAARSAIMRTAEDDIERQRAALVEEKLRVDDELRTLNAEIGDAKRRAFTRGSYLPPTQFRRLEQKAVELKDRSLAIQTALGRLRELRKKKNVATHENENHVFRRVAHEMLPEETFLAIEREVDARLGKEGVEP